MSHQSRSNYKFMYLVSDPEKLYTHFTIVVEKKKEIEARGYELGMVRNSVRNLMSSYDLEPDGYIDEKPGYLGYKYLVIYENWGDFKSLKDFSKWPTLAEFIASKQDPANVAPSEMVVYDEAGANTPATINESPCNEVAPSEVAITVTTANEKVPAKDSEPLDTPNLDGTPEDTGQAKFSESVLRKKPGMLILGLTLVALSIFAYASLRQPAKPVDIEGIIASFSWGEDGVALTYSGQILEKGTNTTEGKVLAINPFELVTTQDKIALLRPVLFGTERSLRPNENCIVKNVRIRDLEPLFNHWGYRCNFNANHQLTVAITADSPGHFLKIMCERGVIYMAEDMIATLGQETGYVIANSPFWVSGTKKELAKRFEEHMPVKFDVNESDLQIYSTPVISQEEATSFFKSEPRLKETAGPIPLIQELGYSQVFGDRLIACNKEDVIVIDLSSGSSSSFSVQGQPISAAIQNETLWVCSFYQADNGNVVFVGTTLVDHDVVSEVRGHVYIRNFSTANGRLFGDADAWIDLGPNLLYEVRVASDGLTVLNPIAPMHSAFGALGYNVKGAWVVSLDSLYYGTALTPVLFSMEGKDPIFLDLPGYKTQCR